MTQPRTCITCGHCVKYSGELSWIGPGLMDCDESGAMWEPMQPPVGQGA